MQKDGGELLRTCRTLLNEKQRLNEQITHVKHQLQRKFYIESSPHQKEVYHALNVLLFDDNSSFLHDDQRHKSPSSRNDILTFLLAPYLGQSSCRESMSVTYNNVLNEMEQKGILGIKPSSGLYTFTDLYVLFMKL